MSSFNPYAAPAAQAAAWGEVPPRGEPQPWDVAGAIKSGWEIYKAHWAPLTLGYFVVTLLSTVPRQIAPVLVQVEVLEEGSAAFYAVHVPLAVLGWLIAELCMAGFVRAALRAVRANDVAFGDFFAAGSRFLAYVGMSLLSSLATVFGLVLLVVPGVIISLGFANAPFFVVDQKLGPIRALEASWEVSKGQKGALFVLALAEAGLTLVGLAACCLGIFVVVPVVMLARAIVYTKMSGTAPPPAPPAPPAAWSGYGAPYGAPGPYGGYGGYGPPGYGPPGQR